MTNLCPLLPAPTVPTAGDGSGVARPQLPAVSSLVKGVLACRHLDDPASRFDEPSQATDSGRREHRSRLRPGQPARRGLRVRAERDGEPVHGVRATGRAGTV